MKIGIYNEPSGGGIGGAESTVAILAEALSATDQVEIVHHRNSLRLEDLCEISGARLDRVGLRYVAPTPYSFGLSHIPWRRYRGARAWHAALSEPYDLFINVTHGIPPFCHARRGALIVLFPVGQRPAGELVSSRGSSFGSLLKKRTKLLYHDWEWQRRIGSYQIRTTISEFSRTWIMRRWSADCQVLYPPVDTHFASAPKANLILSAGRFTTEGHSKKQSEMIDAFRQMKDDGLKGWEYTCAGSLGESARDNSYFKSVEHNAAQCGAEVFANLGRDRLKKHFEMAKIFWHAAGYGEDDRRPEMFEHFGIVTVEAMAAGCVPVVINKGGQSEIVRHGVSGFLWDTFDELKQYTSLLARDERLRTRMADEARRRAQLFSREAFVKHFLGLLCA
ncbi:MAG TPA: glycosyltransferase [Blastocatellia bacterium]|nr:glycosyltransferase [Blastocatellia bacterium]